MDGNNFVNGLYGPTLPAGWALVGAEDFTGDGKPDYVLFEASTRRTAYWYMDGNIYGGGTYGPTLPAGWNLAAP